LRFSVIPPLAPPPVLHPFPTRRSSDLPARTPDPVRPKFTGQRISLGRGSGSIQPSTLLDRPRSPIVTGRPAARIEEWVSAGTTGDRKSTRLNSSHVSISYAVFCLKKKT